MVSKKPAAEPAPATQQPQKIILDCHLSPGDVMTMTAALECLHAAYPGQFLTDVRCTAREIFDHNPRITPIADDDRTARKIHMSYPDIHQSSESPHNFIWSYAAFLSRVIGAPVPPVTNRPHIYLTEEERSWQTMPQEHFHGGKKVPYAVIVAGTKSDYTCKQYPVEHYQKIVDLTLGRWQWVQIGADEHNHPKLKNVIDLVGKTTHRMLHRLVYHSVLGVGPVTYLMHLCAAFERPYFYLAGGREPITWVCYPKQHTLHTMGALPCCFEKPCWRDRVVALKDGDNKDNRLCERPIVGLIKPSPQCMAMIRPETVVSMMEMYAQ